jgi:formylglycine-generating enzyme required for sulfatase activity
MTDDSRIDDLLSLYEQRHSEGQPLSDQELQDLCRRHPEDLAEVRRQLTRYRLPTEAKWECACRMGTVTSRSYGSADELLKYYGWHRDNGGNRTWPVGLLKPNDVGLFDMYGNVAQWCSDSWYFSKEVEERVLRGSHDYVQPEDMRTASPDKIANRATYRGNDCGMRLTRTLPKPGPPP